MSSLTYENYYQQALEELSTIWREDANVLKVQVPASGKQRYEQLLRYWVSLYIKYLRTAQRLALVHDAQLQPQKRMDVRTLLDSSLGRMLELRGLLTANCGEFVQMDDMMLDLKMCPSEMEVPIPRYFVEDATTELQERQRQIASLQAHFREVEPNAPVSRALSGVSGTNSVDPPKDVPSKMTVEEAVAILQVNERGRQARQRAKFQLAMYLQQKHMMVHSQGSNYAPEKERAATLVQKATQAYIARKKSKRSNQEELELLGMRPTAATRSTVEQKAAEVRLDDRKARQRMNETEYHQKMLELQSRIRAEEGPRTMEEMLSEVLTRMAYARMESKDDAPLNFPTPEEGGSRRYLAELDARAATGADGTTNVNEGLRPASSNRNNSAVNASSVMRLSSAVPPGSAVRGASTVRSSIAGAVGLPQKPTSVGGGGRRRNEEEEVLPVMSPSYFWDHLQSVDERYRSVWKQRFEESYHVGHDLDQRTDEALLRQQLLEGPRGIMEEMRQIVDQLILDEVENLKKRLEQEKRGKKKKGAKKGGKKGPRKPKLKDPTKGVDIETFMNSAVHENVLQLPKEGIQIGDYIGTVAVHASPVDYMLRLQKPDDELKKKWQRILNNWDANVESVMKIKKEAFQKLFDKYLLQASWLSEPSMAQVRQALTEYAILPLGSQVIHDLAPSVKALLLYGFPRNGKTMLVHAVCNHTSANLFDLSPANFETNSGMGSIIQMVFHLAKVKAPSVIMIDKVEKIFMKKKKKKGPKDLLALRGKKMKKEILKGIAGLSPTDRVVVIGTSSAPWDGDFNAMINTFAHMIHCPFPDYASRLVLLQKLIARKTGDVETLKPEDYHELVILTEGLAGGDIIHVVEEVLHDRRLRRISQRSLSAAEFLRAITREKPPSLEEQAMLSEFNQRLPLHLRRLNPPVDLPPPDKDKKARRKK